MPAQAQVSVRFSVQDQEVVKKALQDLGRDGEAALKKLETASHAPSSGLSAVSAVVHQAKEKISETSGELGIFGTALRAVGPVGLVVAGALGAVVAVIYEMKKRAEEFGDKAIVLNTFAEAAGVSVRNIQALTAEGAKFGLGSDQIATGIEKFSVNVEALRKGTGPLFEQLTRINPALRDQLAAARDTAAAYDVAGRAINSTTDAIQRNALARALFGRGAAAQGLLAGDVVRQGGLDVVSKEFEHVGKAIDGGMTKAAARLRAEIKELQENSRLLNDSWFAVDVLQREKEFEEGVNRIAIRLAQMRRGGNRTGVLPSERADLEIAGLTGGGMPVSPLQQRPLTDRERGLDMLAGGLGTKTTNGDAVDSYNKLSDGLRRVKDASAGAAGGVEKVGDATKSSTPPIEVQLAVMRLHIGVLGSAATPTEQLKLKMLELAVALKEHHATAQEAARAQNALKLAQDQTAVSARERLGIAREEQILSVQLRQLADDRAKGYVKNAAEMAQAEAVIAKQVKATAEQVQVTAAALPQLKRFELDAADGMKALDQVTTSSLNAAGNALVEFGTGAKDSGHAFGDFARSVISDIERMIIKMYLLAPLAKMLQPGAGGLLSLLGVGGGVAGSAEAGAGAGGGAGAITPMALGGIMTPYGPLPLRRYRGGGIANSPQVAIYGEKPGVSEAYVPLPDGRSIPVSISMPNASSAPAAAAPGGNVHIYNYGGAQVSAQQRPNPGGGADWHVMVRSAVRGVMLEDVMSGGPVVQAYEQRYRLNRTQGLS